MIEKLNTQQETLESSEVTYRKLQGRSGKGMTEVPLMRQAMLKWILCEYMDSLTSVPSHIKDSMRQVFAGHQEYKAHRSSELSFMSTWPSSALSLYDLAEMMLKSTESMSYTILTGIKESKTATEILRSYEPFKSLLLATDKLEDDHKKRTGTGIDESETSTEQINQLKQGSFNVEDISLLLTHQQPDELGQWGAVRDKEIAQNVSLILDTSESTTDLADKIRELTLSHYQPVAGETMMILFDSNVYAIADSRPQWRRAPVDRSLYKKLIGACKKVRATSDGSLPVGDIYCIIDGGRGSPNMFLRDIEAGSTTLPIKSGKTIKQDCMIYSLVHLTL